MCTGFFTGATKSQGLTGVAIVAGYAVIFAFAFLLLSIFFAYKLLRKSINILNGILAFLLAVYIAILVSSLANKMGPKAAG